MCGSPTEDQNWTQKIRRSWMSICSFPQGLVVVFVREMATLGRKILAPIVAVPSCIVDAGIPHALVTMCPEGTIDTQKRCGKRLEFPGGLFTGSQSIQRPRLVIFVSNKI